MISVVCVYNNEATLRVALLKSLESQSARFELILLDNRDGRYKSAAQALNDGGGRATGNFVMFAHQDMWLATNTWLEDAEGMLTSLPGLGVAGVAGVGDNGRNWFERVKFSINVLDTDSEAEAGRVHSPVEVQTLDECVLIVPKAVFGRLKFDEAVFDGWDCYGADYCLSVKQMGLKAYVLPLPSSHSCSRASYPVWHFESLFKYQKRLYQKHGRRFKRIYTWMDTISWWNLKRRGLKGFFGPLYHRLFPNIFVLMKRELSGCRTVLDLGCGHHSPLQVCDVPFSVGVELFEPSMLESRRTGIHSQYIRGDVTRICFKRRSFDAVIAVEVLEHLTKDEGGMLLRRMEEWARKKVVITTPNGYLPQDAYDGNPLQEHRSGWDVEALKSLGFKVRGSAGWKALKGRKGYARYQPAFFWNRVSDLTQPIVYRFPKFAFQLVAVKTISEAGKE